MSSFGSNIRNKTRRGGADLCSYKVTCSRVFMAPFQSVFTVDLNLILYYMYKHRQPDSHDDDQRDDELWLGRKQMENLRSQFPFRTIIITVSHPHFYKIAKLWTSQQLQLFGIDPWLCLKDAVSSKAGILIVLFFIFCRLPS